MTRVEFIQSRSQGSVREEPVLNASAIIVLYAGSINGVEEDTGVDPPVIVPL